MDLTKFALRKFSTPPIFPLPWSTCVRFFLVHFSFWILILPWGISWIMRHVKSILFCFSCFFGYCCHCVWTTAGNNYLYWPWFVYLCFAGHILLFNQWFVCFCLWPRLNFLVFLWVPSFCDEKKAQLLGINASQCSCLTFWDPILSLTKKKLGTRFCLGTVSFHCINHGPKF